MGTLRYIALAVLLISFATFVAFFGRLPALRKTPVGALHRVIWIHIPRGFRAADEWATNGRLSRSIGNVAHTLWYDKHPVVVIFFVILLLGSEMLFLPDAWPLLTTFRKMSCLFLVLCPYTFLYLSMYTDPGIITPENHSHYMTLYPYDYTIFYPGETCRTCHLLKPARSKHCSICKHCVAKLDHHCIFINNCVGYENQHWFILLLFSTAVITTYATYLGISLLSSQISKEIPSWTLSGKGMDWVEYLDVWGWALQAKMGMGCVTLLCLFCSPLVWGLLGYHIYLIWAGTTTNESLKWSDWAAEMADGFAFKRKLPRDRERFKGDITWTSWPVESEQIVMRTEDGRPPSTKGNPGVGEWERVWRLADVENLYDLGFQDNLADVFLPRVISEEERGN
ncbi:DHHC palmitoyltransferase-domain-containing protein [Xylogone sp. PMI_703]|nr:DHHC palmitoyltransferase-domain-containing protein [Xylogone sp. PMI_703]